MTRSHSPSKTATKTGWTDFEKIVDGGVGKLLLAKRNQVKTQLVVPLDLPLSIGINFWGLLTKRVAGQRCESHDPSLVGREIQAVLQGLSIPKRIRCEVMRPCILMRDRHASD